MLGFGRWDRAKTLELLPDLAQGIEACGFPIAVDPFIDCGPTAIMLGIGVSTPFEDALERGITLFSLLESLLTVDMADLPRVHWRGVRILTAEEESGFLCWHAQEQWPEWDGYSTPRFEFAWPPGKSRSGA